MFRGKPIHARKGHIITVLSEAGINDYTPITVNVFKTVNAAKKISRILQQKASGFTGLGQGSLVVR